MGQRTDVSEAIRAFLGRANKATEFDEATPLFAEGLALDSLETAELSAILEDEFGSDPFSAGEVAETVGEIYAYYDKLAS